MARFKPQVSYITKDSFFDTSRKTGTITECYDTYAELKKNLKEICEKNIDADGVFVVRSKRGQWGEWFERWELDAERKPTIIKEGWS